MRELVKDLEHLILGSVSTKHHEDIVEYQLFKDIITIEDNEYPKLKWREKFNYICIEKMNSNINFTNIKYIGNPNNYNINFKDIYYLCFGLNSVDKRLPIDNIFILYNSKRNIDIMISLINEIENLSYNIFWSWQPYIEAILNIMYIVGSIRFEYNSDYLTIISKNQKLYINNRFGISTIIDMEIFENIKIENTSIENFVCDLVETIIEKRYQTKTQPSNIQYIVNNKRKQIHNMSNMYPFLNRKETYKYIIPSKYIL